jgi:hypothetical protein
MQKHENPDIRGGTDTWVFRLRKVLLRFVFGLALLLRSLRRRLFVGRLLRDWVSPRLEADLLCAPLELAGWPGAELAWAELELVCLLEAGLAWAPLERCEPRVKTASAGAEPACLL